MAPPKGWKPTPEQKKRMGDSHRGFKHTEETCKIYSESKKGEKNPMYGKHHTEEHKKLISKIHTGKIVSEETKKRMSEAQKNRPPYPGHKQTQESKDKVSKARKGMKFSEEHRKHLSEAHKGQVVSKEERKRRSEYMKSHPEAIDRLRKVRCIHPTKPQLELFETIKTLYPDEDVKMEHVVIISKNSRKFIDVAVPRLRLGFEYDSKYWHGGLWGSKEKDLERHNLIESLGWKLTHYSDVSEFPKK